MSDSRRADGTQLIEISIGADDGIKPGYTVEVFRGDRYLGRAVIERATPTAPSAACFVNSSRDRSKRVTMSQPSFESASPAPSVLTKKSAWNVYTAMLLIALVCLLLAALFLYFEIREYGGFGT